VFVVDVPERDFFQNASNIRDLEDYCAIALRSDRAPNRLKKEERLIDMLEGHFATDEIGLTG
jgi:hypothetical protein